MLLPTHLKANRPIVVATLLGGVVLLVLLGWSHQDLAAEQ